MQLTPNIGSGDQVGSAVGSAAFHAPSERRRIAVVCSYTVSLVNFRFQLLKTMVERGHEVVAYGPELHRPTVDALAAIGVSFVQIPMARTGLNPLQDARTLTALWRALRTYSPDVVLCYTMKPVIYGLMAARFAGIRQRHALITGLGYVFSDGEGPRLAWIRRIATWMYRFALQGGGRVFVYNDADAADIRNGGMVDDLSRIIPVPGSGVDLSRFVARDVPLGVPVFLIVARLLREKGFCEFAEAAKTLRQVNAQARFQILGPLDPSPLAISRGEVDRWATEAGVEYLGETTDVRPHLAACSVFVLPSFYREGIPRSILEAMATGRAIITTDTPGCRDTVVDGENGFIVPPCDANALAAAMKRFIDDPALAQRMGRRSLEIARSRFDAHAVNRLLLTEMEL